MHLTCNTTHTVNDTINELFADGVVATSVVVRRILLATDQELRVEQVLILAGADLINRLHGISASPVSFMPIATITYRRIKVDEDAAWDIFAAAGLRKECVEGAALSKVSCVWVRLSVCLEAVLEKVQSAVVSATSIAPSLAELTPKRLSLVSSTVPVPIICFSKPQYSIVFVLGDSAET